MTSKPNNAYIGPIIIGIILIFIGLITPIPGGALTTYESFNGEVTDDYVFDNKYSSIDEYVGGMLCLCFGITMKMLQKNEIIVDSIPLNDAE